MKIIDEIIYRSEKLKKANKRSYELYGNEKREFKTEFERLKEYIINTLQAKEWNGINIYGRETNQVLPNKGISTTIFIKFKKKVEDPFYPHSNPQTIYLIVQPFKKSTLRGRKLYYCVVIDSPGKDVNWTRRNFEENFNIFNSSIIQRAMMPKVLAHLDQYLEYK